jgi:hypothetical protein
MAVVHSSTSQFELQSRHEVGVDANFIFCTLSHRFKVNNGKKQSEELRLLAKILLLPTRKKKE